MGLLNKIKIYTIGSMEYQNGESWRNHLKDNFRFRGITVLDPYHKQFVQKIDESEERRVLLKKLRQEGEFEKLAEYCKEFRAFDLSCVDKSDAVVWYLDVNVPTIGSVEEFAWAVRLKRPSYVVVKQGIKECPLWIFGMTPVNYIMSSLDEFIIEIGDLDTGRTKLDNRWRIFSEEIR